MLRKIGFALLVMVSKVTVKDKKYTNVLMGTVQAAASRTASSTRSAPA